MKRGFQRADRVADLIQKTLAPMLLQEMSDERFQLVTVTGVSVARDCSFAKVFVSVLMDDKEKIKQTVDALNQLAKTFRYRLAQTLTLRVVPDLRFVYDDSTAYGFKISSLIESAIQRTDQDEQNQEDKKTKEDKDK